MDISLKMLIWNGIWINMQNQAPEIGIIMTEIKNFIYEPVTVPISQLGENQLTKNLLFHLIELIIYA